MAIQHYKGRLGDFKYDDEQFQVMWVEALLFRDDKTNIEDSRDLHICFHKDISEDYAFAGRGFDGTLPYGCGDCSRDSLNMWVYGNCNICADTHKSNCMFCKEKYWHECLRYVGNETDGLRINIPDGILDCKYMFCKTNLTSAPIIPDGVEACTYMFWDCKELVTANIIMPDTVKDCGSMFAQCPKLIMPPVLSSNAINCGSMFFDDICLEVAPNIPASVLNCLSMFHGCSSLKIGPIFLQTETNKEKVHASYMFLGCENLEEIDLRHVISFAQTSGHVFHGCNKLVWSETKPSGALVHYNGELGEFNYDPDIFQIQWRAHVKTPELRKYGLDGSNVFFQENNLEYDCEECLRYVGRETDGAKISIPIGIMNCRYMFFGCDLVTPPIIPDGVQICDDMFGNNKWLTVAPDIPSSVYNCEYMFRYCSSLLTARIPTSIRWCERMFWHCIRLTNVEFAGTGGNGGMETCKGMFEDCFSLKHLPAIPDGVWDCEFIALNCVNLETAGSIPSSVVDLGGAFSGCESLVAMPEFLGKSNERLWAECAFAMCKNLEIMSQVPPRALSRCRMFYHCDKLQIEKKDARFVHYKGALGEFNYNSEEFCVLYVEPIEPCFFSNVYDEPGHGGALECLHYIGWEKDGSKVTIPNGIKNCRYMFAGSDLVTPPVIPDGVIDCTGMFAYSAALSATPVIPDSVEMCSEMFAYCMSLTAGASIPANAKYCCRMYENCLYLTSASIVPDDVCRCNMFRGCERLPDYEELCKLDSEDMCPYHAANNNKERN